MTRLTQQQTACIVRVLEPLSPAVIYVFGSHGTPARHPHSDIDIAFLPESSTDAFRVFQIASTLSSELGGEVDLIDLSRASTVLRKEVIRTGDAIHVRDELAMRKFEMRSLSDYARLNEERHEVLASL